MNRYVKSISLILVIFLLAISALGCGSQQTQSQAGTNSNPAPPSSNNDGNESGDIIKIGIVGPLSGSAASYGFPLQYGVEMAVEQLNKNGGLEIDGKKYKVKTIAYEDKFTADGAVTAVNRLIFEDKVKFIFGTIGSAGVLAIQELTEKNKVLLMPNSYTPKAVSKDKPLTFRVLPTSEEFAGQLAKWVQQNYPDKKRVAFIASNDESGWAVQAAGEKAMKKLGFEIVAKELPERGTQDYNPILTKVMSTKPDIIAFGGTPPGEVGIAMKQAAAQGYDVLFTTFSGPAIQDILKVAGPSAEDFVYFAGVDLQSPKVKNLFDTLGSKYQREYLEASPSWFDAANILFKSMKEANSLDPEVVAESVRKMKDYDGVQGVLNWTGQETYGMNQQIKTPVVIGQVKDGKPTIVEVSTE